VNDLSTTDWIVLVVITLPFVVVWVGTIVEVVRRPDLRGLRAVVWVGALLLFPVVAVAAHVIVRRPRPKAVEVPAGPPTRAERFVELAERRQAGQIDDDAFRAEAAALVPAAQTSG